MEECSSRWLQPEYREPHGPEKGRGGGGVWKERELENQVRVCRKVIECFRKMDRCSMSLNRRMRYGHNYHVIMCEMVVCTDEFGYRLKMSERGIDLCTE